MTHLPTQTHAGQAKPQPTVYTVLIIVAILVLAVGIGFSLHFLMSSPEAGGYGREFSEIFTPWKAPVAPK